MVLKLSGIQRLIYRKKCLLLKSYIWEMVRKIDREIAREIDRDILRGKDRVIDREKDWEIDRDS